MKAIILTYDKQIGLAELVVKSYMALWKECPFQFTIPRNDQKSPHFDFLKAQKNVALVPTATSIHATMLGLLEAIDDDEWVYWCIDDRYPVQIDQPAIQSVFEFIKSGAADDLNAIKLMHWKEQADQDRKDLRIGDRTFRFQERSCASGYWHHHFLRAKALKEVFVASAREGIPNVPLAFMEFYMKVFSTNAAFSNRVFPVDRPVIHLGETLANGKLLVNAREALAHYNCPVPGYETHPYNVFFRGKSISKGDHCTPAGQPMPASAKAK